MFSGDAQLKLDQVSGLTRYGTLKYRSASWMDAGKTS
jgi:hypothetical protein